MWDTPQGVFPTITGVEKNNDTRLRSIEQELFAKQISEQAGKLQKQLDKLGDPMSVIRINQARFKKAKSPYIRQRILLVEGKTVSDATQTKVPDKESRMGGW